MVPNCNESNFATSVRALFGAFFADFEDREQGTREQAIGNRQQATGTRDQGERDAEDLAGDSAAGTGAADQALSQGAAPTASAGGMAAGDAAGDGFPGGGTGAGHGTLVADDFPDRAVGAEPEYPAEETGEDGAGSRMRPGLWVGAVAAIARRSRAGAGGAGPVAEEIYDEMNREP